MTTIMLRGCIFSIVALQFVLCNDYSPNSKVNVIRIQNNGSQIRTIYLPNQSWSTTTKPDTKTNNTSNSNNFILIEHPGNHISHNGKLNKLSQKQKIFDKYHTLDPTKKLKYTVKIQKISSLDIRHGQTSTNKRNKGPLTNRTLLSMKAPGVEYKVNVDKIAKLLNIFTIVNFTNEVCYTEDGTVGTCYHATECQSIFGEPRGSCAQGFGVCCQVARTCGDSSAVNNTYMTTSGISHDANTGVYICTVLIYKTNPDVVQLRLSFDHFELAGPVEGNCIVDRFVVTGQNQNDMIPPLCGYNTGKHVYIDIGESEGPVSLTLLSSGAHGVPRDFRIRVTQLKKHNPHLAPRNCLQYYTEPRGSIESFNYIPYNSSIGGITPGYFNNLNYAICFKKSDGMCGIMYSNTADGGMEIVNRENDGTSTVPEGQAGAESFDCPDDFITTSSIRLCGYKLNDGSSLVDYTKNYPVIDNTNGPLIMRFQTNQNVTGRGFHLEFLLRPCYSSGSATTMTTAPAIPSAATRAPYLA